MSSIRIAKRVVRQRHVETVEHVYGLHDAGTHARVVAEYVVFDPTRYRVCANSDHSSARVILECIPCDLKTTNIVHV